MKNQGSLHENLFWISGGIRPGASQPVSNAKRGVGTKEKWKRGPN